ncbi:hypothetical protein L0938_05830 [Paracidovorax citrulli]
MTVLAFRGHGRQRVDRIQAALQQRVEHWRAQWATEPRGCQVQAVPGNAPQAEGQWWTCATRHLHLCLPAGGAAALGNALAAVGDGQGAALATAIGSRAVVDLLADLGAMDVAASTVPAAAQLDRRHGVLAFALDLPGTVAALYLPIGLCDTLAPPAPTAVPLRLASRRDAVLASTTRLTATLELGDASLDAATGLRAGEILGGSRIADAVVHVRDAAGNTVFTAHLQSSDGRKALVCTHVEHQPGRT